MKFPSTLLPQTNDPKDIQKGLLDLLDKINQIAGGGTILTLNQQDYTERANDGWSMISATTGSTTRKVTLLSSSGAQLRSRIYSKADSGAGELQLVCQGKDVIFYPGGSASSVYVGLQNQRVTLLGVSGGYLLVGGVVQPVAGEPDVGGGYHVVSSLPSAGTFLVQTSTTPAFTWSAAVTMTSIPAGVRAGYSMLFRIGVTNPDGLVVAPATGLTLNTAVNSQYEYAGLHMNTGGTANDMCIIPLDASQQFKWMTVGGNSAINIGYPVGYWLGPV